MFVDKDCPQKVLQTIFACGSQNLDHTTCCKDYKINEPKQQEKCLNLCKTDVENVKVIIRDALLIQTIL
jgi:hypothetical protein